MLAKIMTKSVCKSRFTVEEGYFVDYAEAARACSRTDDSDAGPGWARFARHVQYLKDKAEAGSTYKLLLVVRHGRGVHNVVMDEVGSAEWKVSSLVECKQLQRCHGDGTRTWFDAELAPLGMDEAKALGQFFTNGIKDKGFPVPDAIYTSPLARCLATAKLVFERVFEDQGRPFKPKVKKFLRERLTDHTCDRRRSSEWIRSTYPEYELETGLAEQDSLWHSDRYESDAEQIARTQQLFEDIFDSEAGTVIALVSHSFTLSWILEVIGARLFRVSEGALVAFLVHSRRLNC
ncbi:hypothetical protein ARSEF4850_006751 [Beauveria asiatica]